MAYGLVINIMMHVVRRDNVDYMEKLNKLEHENEILRQRLRMCKESHKSWKLKWEDRFYKLDNELEKARMNKFIHRDTWNMDHNLAKMIKEALVYYKANRSNDGSIPGCFKLDPTNDDKTQEELLAKWNLTLDKMIKAWDIMGSEDSERRYLNNQKIVDEGLQLFVDYFAYLWD